jgi:hypothetical protein
VRKWIENRNINGAVGVVSLVIVVVSLVIVVVSLVIMIVTGTELTETI